MIKIICLIFITLFSLNSFSAESFKLQKIVDDQNIIWGFDFLKSGDILFTERSGKLKLFKSDTSKIIEIKGLPKIHFSGQGGLLDVILDSSFETNSIIFLTYSYKQKSGSTTAVYRASLSGNKLINGKTIFTATTNSTKSIHYGSRIRESKNGFLFVSIGDRGKRHEAQKLDNHHGKILRITKEGKPAPGNPFIDKKEALPEIWTYGHRNPQGMHYDSITDNLWVNEHGPRGGDEINLVTRAKNYGWPVITYGKEYWGPSIGEGFTKEGMEQPLYYFVPSIAPSGLIRYSGKMFSSWKQNFFSGALKLTHLNRVFNEKGKYKEERNEKISQLGERIRSVKEHTDGSIFFSTDSGKILRLAK